MMQFFNKQIKKENWGGNFVFLDMTLRLTTLKGYRYYGY